MTTKAPTPKPLKWMGREWKHVTTGTYSYRSWSLRIWPEDDEYTLALVRLNGHGVEIDALAPTTRDAMSLLAGRVRAVGRLADG